MTIEGKKIGFDIKKMLALLSVLDIVKNQFYHIYSYSLNFREDAGKELTVF